MQDHEHQAAAAKIVAAVKNNRNGAYDEWVSSGSDLKSKDAQAAFIQKHAGLAATPSAGDMNAIYGHVKDSLQSDVSAIAAKNPGANTVGSFCLAEE